MAGRNKQPLTVILGKGVSNHITKAEAEKRAAHEEKMRGNTDKIQPPSYLLKKQKEEFNELAEELIKLGIFSNLDIDTLGFYIEARTNWQKLGPVIRKLNPIHDLEEFTKLNRTRKQFSDECRAYASELGLSITARLKLVIPPPPETEKTAAEKRFSSRL